MTVIARGWRNVEVIVLWASVVPLGIVAGYGIAAIVDRLS